MTYRPNAGVGHANEASGPFRPGNVRVVMFWAGKSLLHARRNRRIAIIR